MAKHLKKTYKKGRKAYKKSRKYHRKSKKGGMPPPIRDSARYSYPPYFPNRGIDGKDVWPLKFEAPKVKDVNVPDKNQFPLGENVIIDIQEQQENNNNLMQSGGYVYDPKLLKKMYSKNKSIKHLKGFRPMFVNKRIIKK